MPISTAFEARLYPRLSRIAAHFGTPFHLYDETGIRDTGLRLQTAFAGVRGFREYFAVKALPNPRILTIMREMGFGFDCSSIPELVVSRSVGARAGDITFTSNNTSPAEFEAALAQGGSIVNLDDISLLPKLPQRPDVICFRYNPGPRRTGNAIIGNPVEAKYGITHEQVIPAYRAAQALGIHRFGLHAMVISNERNYTAMVETTRALLELAACLKDELNIRLEFINIGGGLGIPYHPNDAPLDIERLGQEVALLLREFEAQQGFAPALYAESGRYMTGPHGVLVTQAINHKDTYRRYIGVDANMSALMRPGMYGAYHHITVPGAEGRPLEVVDVAGALCENNDKFAIQRPLPHIEQGDLLVIHDTGAHGHSMGFNYNGRLRPQELLLTPAGTVERIRRAETLDDYLATLHFEPDVLEG